MVKVVTSHKAAAVTVHVYSQEITKMASRVVIRNSKIERETLHIVETFNGTIKVFLNMNGGQHLGNIQHMFEEFFEVHVVQVIVLLSFE